MPARPTLLLRFISALVTTEIALLIFYKNRNNRWYGIYEVYYKYCGNTSQYKPIVEHNGLQSVYIYVT